MILKYRKGAEYPTVSLTWNDINGQTIDFSAGYTFEFKIGHASHSALHTKTTNISGAATSPNVSILFTAGELDAVPAGMYEGQLRANQSATDKDRFMYTWFLLFPAVN